MTDIRKYAKGDEKKIVSLFNEVYNASRKEDYWKWQFLDNPRGEAIIVLGEDNSNIIGQSSLLPTILGVKGKEILAGQSVDTMISKEFRARGIYEEMAITSHKLGEEKGMDYMFGFPTQEAYRGLFGEDINAKFVTDIPLFINIYKMDNFLLGIVKLKFLAKILAIPSLLIAKFVYREKRIKIKEDYFIKEISEFNEDFDILWEKIKEDSSIMTKRSSEFLNWRIKNHPKIKYKTFAAYLDDDLVGYVIIKTEKRKVRKNVELKVGTIVDIVGLNEDVISALYYRIRKHFKSIKIDFAVAWVSESMKYRQLFIDLGFYKTKGGIAFAVKNLREDNDLNEYVSSEKNWYLMPIESDIY